MEIDTCLDRCWKVKEFSDKMTRLMSSVPLGRSILLLFDGREKVKHQSKRRSRTKVAKMQAVKETASDIKSGIQKTKAVAQDKMSGMRADGASDKEMVIEEKEERIKEAEAEQGKTHSYSISGATGQPTGAHQMSALPGHGSGQPTGQVVEGVVRSHPIGKATGTQRPSAAHNTHVGGGVDKGYDTGGSYT